MGVAKKIPQRLTVMVKPGLAQRQCPVTFRLSTGKPIEYLCLRKGIVIIRNDSQGTSLLFLMMFKVATKDIFQ